MRWKFDLQPYVGPLPIRFGMSEEQIVSLLGHPQARHLNRRQEPDWDYGEFSVRFGSGGEGVVEVGYLPEAELTLFGINLFGDPMSFAKVISINDDVFEDFGFIVIPSLGLTFTGFHEANEADKAITVFAKGRWDGRKSKLTPFPVKKWIDNRG